MTALIIARHVIVSSLDWRSLHHLSITDEIRLHPKHAALEDSAQALAHKTGSPQVILKTKKISSFKCNMIHAGNKYRLWQCKLKFASSL